MLKKLILPRMFSPPRTDRHLYHIQNNNLERQRLGLLPAEILVGAEVTELGGLVVDWPGQVKLLDNDTGSQVEVGTDNINKLLSSLVGGTVSVDVKGARLSNTDSVRQLNQRTACQLGVHQRLGNPSSKVGSRSIDLGEVLSRESTTTVSAPTTVGIDDDLTAGQTGVTLRSTNDEKSTGLNLRYWLANYIQCTMVLSDKAIDITPLEDSRTGGPWLLIPVFPAKWSEGLRLSGWHGIADLRSTQCCRQGTWQE